METSLLRQAEALEARLQRLRISGGRLNTCTSRMRTLVRDLRLAQYLETGEHPARVDPPDRPLPRDSAAALRELYLEAAALENALYASGMGALADAAKAVGESLRELLRSIL